MRILKLLILFTLYTPLCFAQKEWSNWYFSGRAGLSFTNSGVQVNKDFISPAPSNWDSYYYSYSKGTAYSDPVTGATRFIAATPLIYDKNYNILPSSYGMRVCSGDAYGFHIIPFQNNPDKFYIVQFQNAYADILAVSGGLQVRCPNAIGLGYSILDLANGPGQITSMNNVLRSSLSNGITLVRHANGKDTWVIVHSYNTNQYHAFLFTDNGVTGPVTTAIGPVIGMPNFTIGGTLAASHNGNYIAASMTGAGDLYLFDFDKSTGQLKSYRTFNLNASADKLLFSPDDSKLYCLGSYLGPGIYQLDLDIADVQGSLTKIADDPNKGFGDMQLGPDGRIYIAGRQKIPDNYNIQYILPVINCPNLAKYACNYDPDGLYLPSNYSYSGFPNLINDYIQQPKAARATEFSLGADTAICFGSFKLSAPEGWQYYKWNTGETTREITITSPGLYYVLAGDLGFSCPTAFGSIKISNAARPLDLGKDTVLCPKLSYTLKLPPYFQDPLWNDGSSVTEREIRDGGRFTLIAKDEKGCTNWDTISVGFKYEPRAQFGKDTTLCNNQTLLLQLQPANNWWQKADAYLWQNGSAKDSFRVTSPGTYWGQVTYQGCKVADTITVSYVTTEGINLGADTTLCTGDSLLLNLVMPGSQFAWSTGETGNSIMVRTGGTYWVRVNNGSCTVSDTIRVSIQSKPSPFLGSDTVLCDGQKLVLSPAITNASYFWQDGSSAPSFSVTQKGNYWVKATVNGCSASDSVWVDYKPLPPVNLGGDTSICTGANLLLNASSADIQSYLWSTGSSKPQTNVSTAGTYWVQVNGLNGCFNRDTVKLTTVPLPVFSLGQDTVLCEGKTLNLQYSLANANYQWSTGSISNSFTINQPRVYWLDVTQNSCTGRDSIRVGYKPMPQVFLGNDTTLCEGSQLLLDATNTNAGYYWQDGSHSANFVVTKPGVYSVAVDKNGCTSSDTIRVNYISKPRFTLGRDTVVCEGMELKLNPQITNASLVWQDGSTGSSYLVKAPGIYRLVATNNCGSTTDEINIERGVCQLIMPNAFTPNGDGLNDVFRVKYPGFVQSFSMVIYNRWGEVVFRTGDPARGWDGKYKGLELRSDTFIWQIDLTTKQGEKIFSKGTVMLIR